ncbi:unnamed protein product, partial [marine sediment metagenome]
MSYPPRFKGVPQGLGHVVLTYNLSQDLGAPLAIIYLRSHPFAFFDL